MSTHRKGCLACFVHNTYVKFLVAEQRICYAQTSNSNNFDFIESLFYAANTLHVICCNVKLF